MKKYKIQIYSLFLLLVISTTNIYAASYDCAKASTLTEKEICQNKTLSLLDEMMVFDYKNQLNNSQNKSLTIKKQKDWIREKRNTCGGDPTCLKDAYINKLDGMIDFEDFNKFMLSSGWSKGRYSSGNRFCSHDYSKASEKVTIFVYCAGDAFHDIRIN